MEVEGSRKAHGAASWHWNGFFERWYPKVIAAQGQFETTSLRFVSW
jgi:hypothetical protein